jgi:hypothetical protein
MNAGAGARSGLALSLDSRPAFQGGASVGERVKQACLVITRDNSMLCA